tara:strand:+ start:4097 stop:4753 length:657 start_codon:yes stop_codon:yes gene_type:complete
MANNYYSLLAKVTDGWTGTLTVTVGSTTATVTPRARTSALKVLERMVYEARRVHGASFVAYVNSASKFYVEMPSTFAIAATGTTAANTGLTANQSGSSAYTFPTAIPSTLLPAYGARMRSPVVGATKGSALLAGGYGFTKGALKLTGRLTLYDTLANSSTFADTLAAGGVYDIGIMRTNNSTDVMTVERFIIRTSMVGRWGRLGSSGRVVCAVQGVSA